MKTLTIYSPNQAWCPTVIQCERAEIIDGHLILLVGEAAVAAFAPGEWSSFAEHRK